LQQEQIVPWSEMPLWMPEEAAPHLKGFMFLNCDKAVSSGLSLRPLRDTIRDTLNWSQQTRQDENLRAGLGRDKEQALLRKWHETR
jgi:2'-hydroxyisoflavone reductase